MVQKFSYNKLSLSFFVLESGIETFSCFLIIKTFSTNKIMLTHICPILQICQCVSFTFFQILENYYVHRKSLTNTEVKKKGQLEIDIIRDFYLILRGG